jgi:hypothetical protein
VPEALAGLDEVRQTSDTDLGDGRHRVVYSWVADGRPGSTKFVVERIGTRFGLFPQWGFAESPVAIVALSVSHDPRFFVNELTTQTGQDSDAAVSYALLVPGAYTFGHESTFLTAEPRTVVADAVGSSLTATVDVRANDRLVAEVQAKVDEYLDACATQDVLFPTGCPFGQAIQNRVISTPEWTMATYPSVAVDPGEAFGTWVVPEAAGTAHLEVQVQSLFDGSVSTFDEDVAFTVSYLITVRGTTITIQEL